MWLGFGRAIFAGPTLELLKTQALPTFKQVFEDEFKLGKLIEGNKPYFRFSNAACKRVLNFVTQIRIRFAYTQDSSNLESVTAICGVWDEAGQKENKRESYEAYDRRLNIARSTTFGQMAKWIEKNPERKRILQWWLDTYYKWEGPDATFGRRFWATTPYEWNWFKTDIYDVAQKSKNGFELINFPTWLNPRNSKAKCFEALETMAEWRWRMMYEGLYTKPAGAIYDCFENKPELFVDTVGLGRITDFRGETNVCRRFDVPMDWPVYIGNDFGPNNTAAVLAAKELVDAIDEDGEPIRKPTGRYFGFGAYKKGGRTGEEHAWAVRCAACGYGLYLEFEEALARWSKNPERTQRQPGSEPPPEIQAVLNKCFLRPKCIGGNLSEQGWRESYLLGGLKLWSPPKMPQSSTLTFVDIGITCVYDGIKTRRLILFSDIDEQVEGPGPIAQISNYSYELNDAMEPTEEIKDKAAQHHCDALRYLCMDIFPYKPPRPTVKVEIY